MTLDNLKKANDLHKELLKHKDFLNQIELNIEALKKSGNQSAKIEFNVSYYKNSDSYSATNHKVSCFISRQLILKQLEDDRYKNQNLVNKFKLEIEKI